MEAIRPSRELEGQTQPKPDVVVAIRRDVVVAVGDAAVPGVVVLPPKMGGTAAVHAVNAL